MEDKNIIQEKSRPKQNSVVIRFLSTIRFLSLLCLSSFFLESSEEARSLTSALGPSGSLQQANSFPTALGPSTICLTISRPRPLLAPVISALTALVAIFKSAQRQLCLNSGASFNSEFADWPHPLFQIRHISYRSWPHPCTGVTFVQLEHHLKNQASHCDKA